MIFARFAVAGLFLASASAARADLATYYVGRDTGTGSNNGHLTFLRAHGDHFHRLGVFGGAEGRIPEGYIGGQLELREGTGLYQGRFVSGEYQIPGDLASGYSDLEIRSISTLVGAPPGSEEAILLGSGRYAGSLSGVSLAIELVSISSGLRVADGLGNEILNGPSRRYNLGPADSFAPFTPTFFTDPLAIAGASYSATLRLVDLNNVAPQSGTFRYEFLTTQAVPEPASLAMLGLGVGSIGLILVRRRKGRPDPVVR